MREKNTRDLFTALQTLYEKGPRTIEDLTRMLDAKTGPGYPIDDEHLGRLAYKAGYLCAWLGLRNE